MVDWFGGRSTWAADELLFDCFGDFRFGFGSSISSDDDDDSQKYDRTERYFRLVGVHLLASLERPCTIVDTVVVVVVVVVVVDV